jgi:four helix bundle protein
VDKNMTKSRLKQNATKELAKRSATECAGIFDICQRLQIIDEKNYSICRKLLIRIVAMLTKLVRVPD